MTDLELLAPARNADIGIAAIDCGADAVYIAGPAFGARQAAGNSMEDVRRLCAYARRYGARIFLTLNTILYDEELPAARRILEEAEDAGVDAIIAQDPAVLKMTGLPVHASTQCAIRTPERARFLEDLGFSRLVLEREMSLEEIAAIRKAVSCELEFFVHGALCVCYSGNCYLSEHIAGRSANRGACIQACRSLYDLMDDTGKVLVRNKALLSLKDYNLSERLGDLAGAGICSFKIEGRLKNISYVRNVTRYCSTMLDTLVREHPESFRRSSFGMVEGGFTPDPDKTFNRGYTQLYLDGKRSGWSSMEATKSMGEAIGTVTGVKTNPGKGNQGSIRIEVRLDHPSTTLRNGDGFSFVSGDRNEIVGFRGDVCTGSSIICKDVPGIHPGARLFRNMDAAFEKELEGNLPSRRIPVNVRIKVGKDESGRILRIEAASQDGRTVWTVLPAGDATATNQERMKALFASQVSKATGIFSFRLESLESEDGSLPLLPASALNSIRRDLAVKLDGTPCPKRPMKAAGARIDDGKAVFRGTATYKENIANHVTESVYKKAGASSVEPAFELGHPHGAELMRTRYCIRYELGLCPVRQGAAAPRPLMLVNNGRSYSLDFDCKHCEMVLRAAGPREASGMMQPSRQ